MKFLGAAIILCWAASSSAQTMVGKWQVDTRSEDLRVAKTYNDDGTGAGVLCTSVGCSAFLTADRKCDENVSYPILSNSSVGSETFKASCITIAKKQYLLLDNLDMAIRLFNSGGIVGFALPLDAGQFYVVRFSTEGAHDAIQSVQAMPPSKKKQTSNSIL